MEQKENKFFDFDAYMEERKGTDKPFVVKAFGEKYELPNDVPFDVILDVQRFHKEEGSGEMSEEQTLKLCQSIFGKETFDVWLKKGIGINGIMVLTEHVMGVYMNNASNLSTQMAGRDDPQKP